MNAEHAVHLYSNQRLPLLSPMDEFVELDYTNRLCGFGDFRLSFPADLLPAGTDIEALAVDARVVDWRKPEGKLKAIDFAGLARFGRLRVIGQRRFYQLLGYHYNEMLLRRVVAYDAGSSEAQKDAMAADTLLSELWDENLGASAAAARQITALGFSLGGVAGTGTSCSIGCSRANLYDAMLKVHKQSRSTMSTAAWFGFVPTGDGTEARFDVRVGRWGQDHRWPDGEHGGLLFGLEQGNMADPDYTVDRRGEITAVYSAGTGRKDTRIEGTVQTDDTRLNASPLNRREDLFDGRNYDDTTALENAARAVLAGSSVVRSLEFDILETDSCRYGVHWGMGDLITGMFDAIQRDYVVMGVRVVVKAGEEYRRAILEEYVA